MVTLIGFYVILKRKQPGMQFLNGRYVIFGTPYGMPSGDGMLRGLFSTFLIQKGRFCLGLGLYLLVSFEQVILGHHNIFQVIVGFSLGVLIYGISHN
jgi:membrane-associated phospholipid phosphatase